MSNLNLNAAFTAEDRLQKESSDKILKVPCMDPHLVVKRALPSPVKRSYLNTSTATGHTPTPSPHALTDAPFTSKRID